MLLFCSNDSVAQNFYRYSNPEANELSINPAYTGIGKGTLIKFVSRRQWLNIEGAPKSSIFSYDTPMKNSGWSVMLISDNISIKKDLGIYGSFAHHLKYKFTNISFGAQLGVLNKNVQMSNLTLLSEIDPTFNNGLDVNAYAFNVGVGLLLHNEYYHLGLSIPRFLGNEYPGIEDNGMFALYIKTLHYHFTAGAKIKYKDKFSINPTLIYRNIQGTPKHWSMLTNAYFKGGFNLGIGIHSFDSFIFMAGYTYKKVLNINGAWDVTFSRISPSSTPFSFELVLSYLIISKQERFVSPRYF
ncbi:MAG: PorP/SprF family type IX secretion system membrane protein [Bacteroidetes bacterium]|nr:PorP/SprF family type IX secretion system membrane protein [Bacteroidota bacterium]MBT7145211.1 PorP/SprF family type IX secretion system membrane protein [Bacteroidota bacterium]MBT7492983.1 PorP/SprF family type IX secretion system membrane protein [Bacteroidota bacterium]